MSKSKYAQCFCPNTTKLNSISNYAFLNCDSIEEVLLPEGLEYIGINSFHGCKNLTTLDLPKSLIKIDKYAFMDCEKLRNVKFNGTIEEWNGVKLETSSNIFYKVPVRKIKCLDGECALRH